MTARSPQGTVWNVQILRFVAAAMVLFGHLQHEVIQRPALATGFTPFEPVWWPGGVDIFFVISGFIMYHVAGGTFGAPGASGRFVLRRLIRLVPPYWFFTVLALAAMALLPEQMAGNRTSIAHIVGSLLFVPVANPGGQAFPVLILGWTLNFEMLFYAMFALGLAFGRRTGLALIAVVLLAFSAAITADPLPLPFAFWSSPILIEFLMGIGLAMIYERGVRLPAIAGWLLMLAAVALLVAVQSAGIPGTAWPLRFLWAGVPSAILCAGGVLIADDGRAGALRRLLAFGGDTSYALYLSHPFVLTLVAMAIGFAGPATYILVGVVACLAGAALFYVLIERPLYRWMNRRLMPRPGHHGVAVA